MKLNLSNNFYKQENNVISERTDLKNKIKYYYNAQF